MTLINHPISSQVPRIKMAFVFLLLSLSANLRHLSHFLCVTFLGFAGGDLCNCDWQRDVNALSTLEEAQLGTKM